MIRSMNFRPFFSVSSVAVNGLTNECHKACGEVVRAEVCVEGEPEERGRQEERALLLGPGPPLFLLVFL